LALHDSGLSICVLEARPTRAASIDARALALSYGSRLLLERIGVWKLLQDISPIRTIHISQRNSFGRAMLRADELNVPDLGYVLPYPALQNSLDSSLQQCDIKTIYDASVTHLLPQSSGAALIHFQHNGTLHSMQARLAVVADGGKLLAQAYPPVTRDYGQSALITHLTCTAPQAAMAFERFTPQGPVALLPFQNGYELVWTAPHQVAQEMLAWDNTQFLDALQQHFGDRVGTFLTVGKRSCFPLGLKRAPNLTPMPHTVLLGNAAQTLHPVAGQGFNMGLRDAWELAQIILVAEADTLGTESMLESYRRQRHTDREAGIRFTDGLVRLFSNELPALCASRAAALSVMECVPFAKRFVAKRMMFGANG
jgi:2-octaprenyl-6-methoxyphenol hydroxylase